MAQPVNIVVSTLSEAEFLLPLLKEYRSQGRVVNVRRNSSSRNEKGTSQRQSLYFVLFC